MSKITLGRRTFLRGAGGVSIALPWLEAMEPPRAWAQAGPKRYVVCFAGMSLGRDNAGPLPDLLAQIVPTALGAGYNLPLALMPLAAVQNDVSIVSGLKIPSTGPGSRDGAGFHKSTVSPLLSGVSSDGPSPNCMGKTSDQVVADDPGFRQSGVKFPGGLQLRVQPSGYRGGGNTGVISWRGAGQKVDPTYDLGLAFNNLFRGIPPAPMTSSTPSPVAGPQPASSLMEDASVIDLVKEKSNRLAARLGVEDRRRLQRHFEEIFDLERRIKGLPPIGPSPSGPAPTPTPTAGCGAPPPPGPAPGTQTTTAAGSTIGYSGEEERAKVMTSIIVKAFACDLARVASLQYTFVQCFMNVGGVTEGEGVNIDVHEIAHLSSVPGGKAQAQRIVMKMFGWHMKHYAGLVAQLKQHGLLDSTVVVFVNEGGLGPAEGKNPASHSSENMMAMVAGGRALGLKPGRHLRAEGQHPGKVIASAMNAVGVNVPGLGEVSGKIAEL